MKSILNIGTLLFFTSILPCFGESKFKSIVLENTQIHPLTSQINERPYQLLISLPPGYEADSDKDYPVLYVTDGYWDVNLINAMYGNMIYDQSIPDFILVGFGYADESMNPGDERLLDMTPQAMTRSANSNAAPDSATGGGENFLKFIKTEAIPYVENTFRVDRDYRVFGGSSLGGFFNLYTMFSDTELFDAYIAISPAVGIAGRWLFNREYNYRWKSFSERNHDSLPTRLFMSGAEKEWTGFYGEILAFNEILKHGEYEDFEYEFRIIDDERHAGTKAEGYSHGIRYAFQPYLDRLNSLKK